MEKRRAFIISIIYHALLLLIVYIFQGMIFPYVRILGLIPLLLPIVSTGVAVYEGCHAGGIAGLFAGILCDASFNEPVGLFTVLLTFSGLLIGALADTVVRRGFVTYILSCIAVLAVSAIIQIFPILFFTTTPNAPLLSIILRQTAYSLVFTIPLWFFVSALGKRAQEAASRERPL
jgi:rod shape-determining protein MreD